MFFLAKKPVTKPAMIFTGINAKLVGFAIPVTTFVKPPATAPTHGPHNNDAKIVPIVSKYIGNFNRPASCPPTKLTATHTGMMRIACIVKSSLIEYFFVVSIVFYPPSLYLWI